MSYYDLLKAIVGSGSSAPPVVAPSLNFTKAANSQYLALRSAGGI